MAVLNRIPGNSMLVARIAAMMAKPTRELRERCMAALCRARLLVPIEWSVADGEVCEGRRRVLGGIYNAQGERFLLAFTSWQELFKWRREPGERVVVLSYEDVRRQVEADSSVYAGFVIDPFGVNLVSRREALLACAGELSLAAGRGGLCGLGREAVICVPRVFSHRLLGAIERELGGLYVVRCAYFLLMETQEQERNYLLVVDFVGDGRRLFFQLSEAAQPFLKVNERIVIVSASEPFGRLAIRGQRPFYRRSRWADVFCWGARWCQRLASWRQRRVRRKVRCLSRRG